MRKTYTFFWNFKCKDEPRQHGTGFAIRNSMLHRIQNPNGSARICTLVPDASAGPITTVSDYDPTLTSEQAVKDKFYGEPHSVISGLS